MAEYNYSDINEAKRRVQEMKGRVRDKTADERRNDIASVISRLRSPREKAFFITVLYVLNSDEADYELLTSVLSLIL